MSTTEQLVPGETYHLYNRGIGGTALFREARNYGYFLRLYARYMGQVAETFAYCLLPNHFHFLVRIRETGPVSDDYQTGPVSHDNQTGPVCETGPVLNPSRQLNNLFIAYSKAFNKAYGRSGSLFQSPFRRKRVDGDRYLAALVVYVHANPQKHGIVSDFRAWPHSSYGALLSTRATQLNRDEVLGWFDGRTGFEAAHRLPVGERSVEPWMLEPGG